jgi:DUF4097 and DUF4098 domain-containing protein YvlB
MKTLLILLLAMAPLTLAEEGKFNCDTHSGWEAESYCEMHEVTIPGTGALNVDGGANGGVSVKGWDRGEILVRSRTRVWNRNHDEAKQIASHIRVDTTGGRIHAEGPGEAWRRDGGWDVSYEIFVPHRTDLTLRTTNGGISLDDVHGRMDFGTTNGGVRLTRVAGDVDGRTTNGGVHIELSGNHWDGERCNVETTNGGVRLLVPERYSAHLETSTSNGGLDFGFPITLHGSIGRHIDTDLGSGGKLIRLTTTNGGISIRQLPGA